MVQLAQHLVLVNEPSHVADLALMNGFDGCLLLGQPVLSLVYNTESTLAHFLLEEILVLDVSVACLDEQTLLNDDVFVEPPVNDVLLQFVIGAADLSVGVDINIGAGQNGAALTELRDQWPSALRTLLRDEIVQFWRLECPIGLLILDKVTQLPLVLHRNLLFHVYLLND